MYNHIDIFRQGLPERKPSNIKGKKHRKREFGRNRLCRKTTNPSLILSEKHSMNKQNALEK